MRHALYLATLWTTILLLPAGARSQTEAGLSGASTLTLDSVVWAVVRNNDRIAAAEYMTRAAQQRVGPAGAWDDPMLMVGVTNLPTSGSFTEDMMTMKMVGLSQSIPWAGQKAMAGKAARAEARAAEQSQFEVEVDLVTAAKLAYVEYYYRQKILEDLKSQRALLEQVTQSVEGKLRANQAGQEDLSAAQADLWRTDSRILSALQELDAARFELSALLGMTPAVSLPPATSPEFEETPASAEAWEQLALQHYPALARLRASAEGYALSSGTAARMRWPEMSLYANYGFREEGPAGPRDDMVGFGMTFSLPIFAGRKQGEMAASMRAMEQGANAEAAQLWRDVQRDLWTLHARAGRLEQSLRLYRERIIPAADDAFRSAFGGYASNRTAFTDLLTYAANIYRDRITADLLALDLARTRVESQKYTVDPQTWRTTEGAPFGTGRIEP